MRCGISNTKAFVYFLADPRHPDVPVYIGSTMYPSQRRWEHQRGLNQGLSLKRWTRSLLQDGLKPEMRIIESCDVGQRKGVERHHIVRAMLNYPLLNKIVP